MGITCVNGVDAFVDNANPMTWPAPLVTTTIKGNLPSMKNQRRIVRNRKTGQTLIIKSPEAIQYEKDFLRQINPKYVIGYDGWVALRARIYYQSGRSDLDSNFLKDLLQTAGIIKNDRQVVYEEIFKGLDREYPRVVFSVYAHKPPEGFTEPTKRQPRQTCFLDGELPGAKRKTAP